MTLQSSGDFREQRLKDYWGRNRDNPSLCKVSSTHAFLIGGSIINYGKTSNVRGCQRYDLETNEWEFMPEIHVGRHSCSSCKLGDSLYVFCGHNSTGALNTVTEALNTVEKLRIVPDSVSEQQEQTWQLISTKNFSRDFTPRIRTIVCPLNANEIVIMGGGLKQSVSDVFIFDVRSERLERVAHGGPIEFGSNNNACVQVAENHVIALVNGNGGGKPYLIEFTKLAPSITII